MFKLISIEQTIKRWLWFCYEYIIRIIGRFDSERDLAAAQSS